MKRNVFITFILDVKYNKVVGIFKRFLFINQLLYNEAYKHFITFALQFSRF